MTAQRGPRILAEPPVRRRARTFWLVVLICAALAVLALPAAKLLGLSDLPTRILLVALISLTALVAIVLGWRLRRKERPLRADLEGPKAPQWDDEPPRATPPPAAPASPREEETPAPKRDGKRATAPEEVLRFLTYEPQTLTQLRKTVGLPIGFLRLSLSELERRGLVGSMQCRWIRYFYLPPHSSQTRFDPDTQSFVTVQPWLRTGARDASVAGSHPGAVQMHPESVGLARPGSNVSEWERL